jgi:hypothetical protein
MQLPGRQKRQWIVYWRTVSATLRFRFFFLTTIAPAPSLMKNTLRLQRVLPLGLQQAALSVVLWGFSQELER